MLTYPVLTAKETEMFDDVIVSTEDAEIEKVAQDAGATVVCRPAELACDQSTVVQVCKHILSLPQYESVESFCCIYATAVLLASQDILDSRKLLDTISGADFVMGVSHYNFHPVQALKNESGYLQPMWPEYKGMQSQYYPELVVSNGTLYWAKREKFLEVLTFYGDRLRGYCVPPERAVDIDTSDDYEYLKNIMSQSPQEDD